MRLPGARTGLVSGQNLLLVLLGEPPPANPLGQLRIRTLLLAGHQTSIAGNPAITEPPDYYGYISITGYIARGRRVGRNGRSQS